MVDLPWSARSRQEQGRKSEAKAAKKMDGRLHPMSGAGSIKFDFSTEDAVIEHKDATKSFTLNATLVRDLFRNATRQGKQPVIIIQFPDYRVEAIVRRTT